MIPIELQAMAENQVTLKLLSQTKAKKYQKTGL